MRVTILRDNLLLGNRTYRTGCVVEVDEDLGARLVAGEHAAEAPAEAEPTHPAPTFRKPEDDGR